MKESVWSQLIEKGYKRLAKFVQISETAEAAVIGYLDELKAMASLTGAAVPSPVEIMQIISGSQEERPVKRSAPAQMELF